MHSLIYDQSNPMRKILFFYPSAIILSLQMSKVRISQQIISLPKLSSGIAETPVWSCLAPTHYFYLLCYSLIYLMIHN